MAAARREAAPAALAQFAPWRKLASEWARVALHGSDDDFRHLLIDADTARLPARLLRQADAAPVAAALERAMGAALVSGATGHAAPPPRLRRTRTVRAGEGKRCGNSYISADKECRLKISGPEWTGSKDSMKARALESMAAIKKPLSHPETGIEMSMNRQARKKTVLQAKSTHAYMAAGNLTEIFLHSEHAGSSPDRKGREEIAAFHSFKTQVSFGKSNYIAEVTTTEYVGDPVHHFKVLHLRPKK